MLSSLFWVLVGFFFVALAFSAALAAWLYYRDHARYRRR